MMKVGDELDVFDIYKDMGRGIPKPMQISLWNAREWIDKGFRFYLGDRYEPQPEYDMVADWLTNNQCKGLLLYGSCGRGKSLLAECILPKLIRYATGKVVKIYSYRDINSKREKIMDYPLVVIDDVGQEEVSMEYGNVIYALPDIIDNAEKKGHLLILSTNYNLESGEYNLKEKYGERVMSRLYGLVKTVKFSGGDLRVPEVIRNRQKEGNNE